MTYNVFSGTLNPTQSTMCWYGWVGIMACTKACPVWLYTVPEYSVQRGPDWLLYRNSPAYRVDATLSVSAVKMCLSQWLSRVHWRAESVHYWFSALWCTDSAHQCTNTEVDKFIVEDRDILCLMSGRRFSFGAAYLQKKFIADQPNEVCTRNRRTCKAVVPC